MKEVYILKKSDRKGKRFVIIMETRGHKHHFGSDVGKTYIDGRTDRERDAWIARHRNDKGWDNRHSGIYYSRHLLWGESRDLKENIKTLEKKDNVKIKLSR
tara:strand:- start:303 stop:605 length:303 start_codon:yes stop_codon:yes gene_type:complete